MPEIQDVEKLISFSPSKRMGKHREYGRGMFAFSDYGEEDTYIVTFPYGVASFGKTDFGDLLVFSGIFKKHFLQNRKKDYRLPYYTPYNPRTAPQQTNRQKITDGVAAWQLLTENQKAVYNKRTIGKGMSGYNLFLKEYLLSL